MRLAICITDPFAPLSTPEPRLIGHSYRGYKIEGVSTLRYHPHHSSLPAPIRSDRTSMLMKGLQFVYEQSQEVYGLPKYAFGSHERAVGVENVYNIDTNLPEVYCLTGKSRSASRSSAVASAILRHPPARVVPAIPRHMLPHLPRTVRESLNWRRITPPKPKGHTRPRMEAFQHRGTGNSPLALSDEDFEARRQRQHRKEHSLQRLVRWKRIIDLKSCRIEHELQDLHAASTHGSRPSRRSPFHSKSAETIVKDIQEVLSSMRALLWAFFDYQNSQCVNCAANDALELLQSIAEVIMEADFDDQLILQDGGLSVPENTRAVLELAEDMSLTCAQIGHIWEELHTHINGPTP